MENPLSFVLVHGFLLHNMLQGFLLSLFKVRQLYIFILWLCFILVYVMRFLTNTIFSMVQPRQHKLFKSENTLWLLMQSTLDCPISPISVGGKNINASLSDSREQGSVHLDLSCEPKCEPIAGLLSMAMGTNVIASC